MSNYTISFPTQLSAWPFLKRVRFKRYGALLGSLLLSVAVLVALYVLMARQPKTNPTEAASSLPSLRGITVATRPAKSLDMFAASGNAATPWIGENNFGRYLQPVAALPLLNPGGTVITVSTTLDDNTTNGNCTLREAVIAANTDTAVDNCPAGDGADTIMVPAGIYTLTLTGANENAAATGDLDITETLTISGTGAVTIDGNATDRVFDINPLGSAITVTLANLTVTNGLVSGGSSGGGIRINDSLTILKNVAVTNNSADYSGGGIFSTASSLILIGCTIADNSAYYGGGISGQVDSTNAQWAIYNSIVVSNTANTGWGGGINLANYGGTTVISNTIVQANAALYGGGGMSLYGSDGSMTIYNSIVVSNTANTGGGIDLTIEDGTAVISNTIVQANAALYGAGGMSLSGSNGSMTIYNSMVVSNTANAGWGGGINLANYGGTTVISNTIVQANAALYGGGGMSLYGSDGSMTIYNSIVVSNTANAGEGGGIDLTTNDGTAVISNTIVQANAALYGGGIALRGWDSGSTTIFSSTVYNNVANDQGGGILNWATTNVSVLNSAIVSNSVNSEYGYGAGVFNDGALAISVSTVEDNTANRGGGIYNDYGSLTLITTTVRGNMAVYGGGALYNHGGSLTLAQSVAYDNHANQYGGAIYSSGDNAASRGVVTITNSTLSGNVADSGDAAAENGAAVYVSAYGTVKLANSTIISNTSPNQGSIYGDTSGIITTTNSVLASQTGTDSCDLDGASFTSLGYNLADDETCGLTGPGDITNTNPLLGSLQDNGGATWTHAPLSGSPVIEAGSPFPVGPTACELTDQRGISRPQSGRCDIGAFEAEVENEAITGFAADNDSPTERSLSTTLWATFTTGSDVNYTWDLGDGTTGNGRVATHYYPTSPAVYTAVVTASNSLNTVTATTVVTVYGAIINVMPEAIQRISPAGAILTIPLTITNTGDVGLDWTIVKAIGDDFDPGLDSDQWLSISNGVVSSACSSPNGNALHFATSGKTEAVFRDLNVLHGGTIEFYLRKRPWGTSCSGAVTGAMWLEYSTDGGATWFVVNTYNLNNYSTFTRIREVIPPAAQTSSTRFRWSQPVSGVANWMIDNISIGSVDASYVSLSSIAGTTTAGTSQVVTVTLDTTSLLSDTYYAYLFIESNDLVTPRIQIPITLQVGDDPITGINTTNSSPTTIGSPTTLTATVATGSNINYVWAFGDGQTGSGAVTNHNYAATGVYTAVVTATNSVSIVTATTTITITDMPIQGLVVINDSSAALGNATTLTATVTAGSNVTYLWDFGDGQTGTGAVIGHTYATAGIYTAVVTASNSVSLMTATTTVTVFGPPDPTLSTITVVGSSVAAADGLDTVNVQVTARDALNTVIPGATVTLTSSESATLNQPAATNANGQTSGSVASTTVGQIVVGAIISDVSIVDMVTITFDGPDLSLSKTGPEEVTAGFPTTYTLTLTNQGLLTATNVLVTDTLPDATTFVTHTSAYTYTHYPVTNTVVWQVGTLPAGNTISFSLQALVSSEATVGGYIQNVVAASTTIAELNNTNNVATVTQLVKAPRPLLALSPGLATLTVLPGQTGDFDLTVGNSGQLGMTNTVITLSALMPWLSATPDSLATVQPGQQAMVTLTAAPSSSVPAGYYRDFVIVREGGGNEQRTILTVNKLPVTRTVQLTLTNDLGLPVANAYVGLLMEDGLIDVTPVYTRYLDVAREGSTAGDGTLTLPSVPVGTYDFIFSAANHQVLTGTLVISEGTGVQSASYVLVAQPLLEVTPSSPAIAVAPGETAAVDIHITNKGAAPLSGLTIQMPEQSWIYLGGPSILTATLQPGESLAMTIFASPPLTANVATYQEIIVVEAGEQQEGVLLTVHVTTETTRDVEIVISETEGEFLDGVSVLLVRQELTLWVAGGITTTFNEQYRLYTDVTGTVVFNDLPIGDYNYLVTKSGYKRAYGTLEVMPPSAGSEANTPFRPVLKPSRIQADGSQTFNLQLETMPFNFSWQVTPLAEGYDIQLSITRDNAADGLAMIIPGRSWDFDSCEEPVAVADEIPVYNLSNATVNLTSVTFDVPGVGVSVNSYPTQLSALSAGVISVDAAMIGELAGGTVEISGTYQGVQTDTVSYTFNPSSFTSHGLQVGQTFEKEYLLEPVIFNEETLYSLELGQPVTLTWIALDADVEGGFSFESDSDIPITLLVTPPDWLATDTYNERVSITITGDDGDVRTGYLNIQVTRFAQGVIELHTFFELGEPPSNEVAFDGTGLISPNCDDSEEGGVGNDGEFSGNWEWELGEAEEGGFGLVGTVGTPSDGTPGYTLPPDLGDNSFPGPIEITGDASQEVRLEISQQTLLEGEGFLANLVLQNLLSQSVDDIAIDLEIRNAAGIDVTSDFIITPTLPTQIGSLTGGQQTATTWLILPNYLNLMGPATFSIKAQFSYRVGSTTYNFETIPHAFTVWPAPELIIYYELPGSDPGLVCADFDLKATILNVGNGPARNVRFLAGEPVIIGPDGQPQGFSILSVHVNGQQLPGNSLNVTLGDIPPNATREIIWRMQPGSPGRFLEFTSDYRWTNYQGQPLAPRISEIHTSITNAFGHGCFDEDPGPGSPDLTVTLQQPTGPILVSDTIQIEAEITNQGGPVEASVTVRFEYFYLERHEDESGVTVVWVPLPDPSEQVVQLDLDTDESLIVTDSFVVPYFANFQVRVTVDPEGPPAGGGGGGSANGSQPL